MFCPVVQSEAGSGRALQHAPVPVEVDPREGVGVGARDGGADLGVRRAPGGDLGPLLPAEVRALLQRVRIIISLGVEGVPLACVGADGYEKRVMLWTLAPLALAALMASVVLAHLKLRKRARITWVTLLRRVWVNVGGDCGGHVVHAHVSLCV